MKKCVTCEITKPFNEFSLNKRKTDGYNCYCKICRNKKEKLRYNNNIEKERQRNRERKRKQYAADPKKALEKNKKYEESRKKAQKIWEENNKEYRRKYLNNYSKTRKQKDPVYKTMGNLRIRINKFLSSTNFNKTSKIKELLGTTPLELKKHLENQFIDGMSWENYGEWHIDHIVPLASSKTIEDVNKLCHYKNLQPLWAFENLSKGCKTK